MGAALVGNNLSLIPLKISFHMKKIVTCHGPISTIFVVVVVQSIKTFLTVKLSQYRKSGSTFSLSEQVAASSNCRQLGISESETPCQAVFVLARPTRPSCAGVLPQELGH